MDQTKLHIPWERTGEPFRAGEYDRDKRKLSTYMCPLSSTSKYVNPRSECIVPSAPTPSTMKLSSSIGVWKPCFPFPSIIWVRSSFNIQSLNCHSQVMLRYKISSDNQLNKHQIKSQLTSEWRSVSYALYIR